MPRRRKRGRVVVVKAHKRSPRGPNAGKSRPRVKRYKRRFPIR